MDWWWNVGARVILGWWGLGENLRGTENSERRAEGTVLRQLPQIANILKINGIRMKLCIDRIVSSIELQSYSSCLFIPIRMHISGLKRSHNAYGFKCSFTYMETILCFR